MNFGDVISKQIRKLNFKMQLSDFDELTDRVNFFLCSHHQESVARCKKNIAIVFDKMLYDFDEI